MKMKKPQADSLILKDSPKELGPISKIRPNASRALKIS
jgi:hypothetical protein